VRELAATSAAAETETESEPKRFDTVVDIIIDSGEQPWRASTLSHPLENIDTDVD